MRRAIGVFTGVVLAWSCGGARNDEASPSPSRGETGLDGGAEAASPTEGDGGGDAGRIPLPCNARSDSAETIDVIHHDGQTFVSWRDEAAGDAGAAYRYDVYRAPVPITQATLASAVRIRSGALNNSGQLFGHAFFPGDRVNPERPMTVIEDGGAPIPQWSGLQVHTTTQDACAFYAVVPTDTNGEPVGEVVPGKNATTVPIEERVAPRAAIKLYDSSSRSGPYVPQTKISGTTNLPFDVILHASNAQGGGAGDYGDYFLYYGDTTMGFVDGLPGVYSVEERHDANPTLMMRNRDTIVNATGTGPMETYWFGYACIPQWAAPGAPLRAYPFTERRLLWMVEDALTRYQADRNRVYCGGGSMGAWGTLAFGLRHPEIFAAIYPDRPRTRQRGLPTFDASKPVETVLMDDGQTLYVDRMDSVRYVTEHLEDLPFVVWGIGRHDGFATWKEQVDFARALAASHHGFAFAWDNGDHGSTVIDKVESMYPRKRFAKNQSYPAFANSSIDDDMGNGDPASGALQGGVNLGFDWTVVADQPNTWRVEISNTRATSTMTVDVTPRRGQAWKPPPGSSVSYTTSRGQSGTVVANAAGLVTVAGVSIAPGQATTLTLTR